METQIPLPAPVNLGEPIDLSPQPSDEPIDLSVQAQPGAESPQLRDSRIGKAAMIKADTDDMNPVEAFNGLKSNQDILTGRIAMQQEARRQVEIEAEEYKTQAVGEGDATDRVTVINDIINEDRARSEQFDGPSRAYLRSIAAPNATEEEIDSLATLHGFLDEIQEEREDIGFLESAGDLALDLSGIKFLHDNFQVVGTLDPFEARQRFENMMVSFKSLSIEEQERTFPNLKAELLDVLPRGRALELLELMVDPSKDADLALAEFREFALVEAVPILGPALGALLGLRKASNIIKTTARLNNPEQAAELNTAVLLDNTGTASRATDVSKETAHNNSLPFNSESFDEGATDGISIESQRNIQKLQEDLNRTREAIDSERLFVREGILDDGDRAIVAEQFERQFDSRIAEELEKNDQILSVERVSDDSTGVTFELTYRNQEGDIVNTESVTRQFTQDDVGHWTNRPKPSVLDKIRSPLMRASGSNLIDLARGAIRLDFASLVVGAQLRSHIKDATKSIKNTAGNTKRRTQELDEVLIYGDEANRTFTAAELRSGVNGFKLDGGQIEAYFKVRALYDNFFDINNDAARRTMSARGVKSVNLRRPDNTPEENLKFGESIDDPERAISRLQSGRVRQVYDTRTGKSVNVEDLDVDVTYASGHRLVALEETSSFKGTNGFFKHVIVKNDDVRELPANVLARQEGYVPRVNTQARYFVQRTQGSNIDGIFKADASTTTIRGFSTEAEATAYLARADEDFRAANPDASAGKYKVIQDRELERSGVGSSGESSAQGLFFGNRRKGGSVPFGLPEEQLTTPRAGALESLALYAENTKNLVSRNEWRIGARQKWINTAEAISGERGIDFDTFALGGTSDNAQFLNNWRDQINVWSGFNSKQEQWWDGFVGGIIDKAVPRLGHGKTTDFLHSIRQKDPAAALRSFAFHSLLGAYNPVQLFVQAQGASVTASLVGPQRWPALVARQTALAATQHMDIGSSAFNAAAKASGMKVEEFTKLKRLWDKSGMFDSMLSNADVEAAVRGYPVASGAVRKFFDSGLMFYRAGEGFNRRMAFLASVDETKDLDAILNSNDLLKQTISRSSDFMLNLGRANRAAWQDGILSVPTQFFQVTAKSMESILFGGKQQAFTGVERMRIFLGQASLYGAAGIPLVGNMAAKYGLEAAGTDQIDIDENPGLVKAINGGIWDSMFYNAFGGDVEIGNRAALFDQLNDLVTSMFTDGTTPLEVLFGPSSSSFGKIGDKVAELWPLMGGAFGAETNTPVEYDDVMRGAEALGNIALELGTAPFSTMSNITKARIMRNYDRIYDRKGRVVAERDFTASEELARLIGFTIGDEERSRDIAGMVQARQDMVTQLADELLNVHNHYWMMDVDARNRGLTTLTDEEKATYARTRRFILRGVDDDIMRQDVLDSFGRKLEKQRKSSTVIAERVKEAEANYTTELIKAFDSVGANTRLTPIVEELN